MKSQQHPLLASRLKDAMLLKLLAVAHSFSFSPYSHFALFQLISSEVPQAWAHLQNSSSGCHVQLSKASSSTDSLHKGLQLQRWLAEVCGHKRHARCWDRVIIA